MKKLNKQEALKKLEEEIRRAEARIERIEKAGQVAETDNARYWGLIYAKSLLIRLE